MSRSLSSALRGLAHPRSRRSRLWACVYSGAFETDGGDSGERRPRSADD